MRNKMFFFGFLLFLSGISEVSVARGDDYDVEKVGVVDMRRIWRNYGGMKEAALKLKQETDSRQQKVEEKKSVIKKLREEYESKSVILSDSEKEKKSAEIEEKIGELQEYVYQVNKELKALDEKWRGKAIEEVKKTVEAYGLKEDYDMILNNTEMFILFSQDKIDITDEILKALAKKYGKK
ncbi:hypothetical protein AB834_06750 [PVC group bacterium (ex Bugula neritina AB1)]|nr:hypothetical protein AB834_06750 [PVC group bacterium (ex Bugula neritina AB1)]